MTSWTGWRTSTVGDGGTPLYHYEYDDFGNITYKSDVGSYAYDGGRPHAVRRANGKAYEYDENGNQTVRPIDVRGASNASATITYTPFDKPRRIEAEHGPTTYEYDGDRQRARKVSPAQITTYVGGLYERHEHTAGGVTHKMHVMGPEGVIAVKTIAFDAAGEEKRRAHFLHPGHDGSAGVITNELGTVVERRSYDPFGQRRNLLGDENVRTLAVFIQGYCQAGVDLGMPEFGATESSLLAEFEKWLATKLDDTRDVAWPTLIATDDPGERNVRTFFARFEEFLQERGDSLSHSADVPWPP
ncbi:hypothetical protein [Sorangium sp. So ce176]|uniref:hypothetical protein n=1 Tax=Sorangium sp. So ce176 TaxID=3133286 RepID=UPI003F616771